MHPFKINYLDHVAIKVRDVEQSARWYQKILGLKRLDPPEWNGIPIFLLAGETGVAIFPARLSDPRLDASSKNIKIDHFAFYLSQQDFHKAQEHYKEIRQDFEFQDHHYFHSIYMKDPDGHTVELTTKVLDVGPYV